MKKNNFDIEIEKISDCISSLHLILQSLLTLSQENPKSGELRIIRSKIRGIKILLDASQKSLLEKDDSYKKIKPILQKQYLEKKAKHVENSESNS